MKRNLILITLAAVVLSACGPNAAASTPATVDSQATAEALAGTMVAQTMAAMPTTTPLPPTETATPLPPTETPTPLPSETATPEATATGSATSLPTPINRYDRPAPLLLVNNSDHTVDLWISGPAYFHEVFKQDNTIYVPLGTYTFVAYVGKKTFSGTMFINNPDKWTLVFFNDKYNFNSP